MLHLIPSFDPGTLKTSHTVDHILPSESLLCPQGKADNLAGMQRVFVGFSAQSQRLQDQDIQLSKTGQENRYIIMLL